MFDLSSIGREIVPRQADQLPTPKDARRASEEILDDLGAVAFSKWWKLTCDEERRLDPQLQITSITVLCAAICESALAIALNHAKREGELTQNKMIQEDPIRWKLQHLANLAATNPVGMIDERNCLAVLGLNKGVNESTPVRIFVPPGRFQGYRILSLSRQSVHAKSWRERFAK